jgi:hypothetical protein
MLVARSDPEPLDGKMAEGQRKRPSPDGRAGGVPTHWSQKRAKFFLFRRMFYHCQRIMASARAAIPAVFRDFTETLSKCTHVSPNLPVCRAEATALVLIQIAALKSGVMRTAVVIASLTLFIGMIEGEAAQNSRGATESPEAVAAVIWRTILTTCPISGAATPAMFYVEPDSDLYEFRNAWTRLVPRTLTDADKLNGVQFIGMAAFGGTSFRTIQRLPLPGTARQWSSFEVGPKNMNAVKSYDDLYRYRDTNYKSVNMEKRNGRWSLELYSLSGGMGHYSLDTLAQVAIKKSCAELMSANPFAADKPKDNVARPHVILLPHH